jgi:CDP-paratose synthetase
VNKALITGITGFLGSHVARRLVQDGWQVVGLKRSTSNIKKLEDIAGKITFHDIDAEPITGVFSEDNRFDAILHFATEYGRDRSGSSPLLKSNVHFPLQIWEQAVQSRVPVFINADTCYTLEYKHLQNYTLSKKQFAQWGNLLATSASKFINMILQHPYGPGDGESKFVPFIVKQCRESTEEIKLTPGGQQKDFLYIDDFLDAITVLLQKADTLPNSYTDIECGSGHASSIREFVTKVHQLSKSKARLHFGALPYRENEIMFSQADTGILQSMGWAPRVSLEEGIQRTIEALPSRNSL